MERGFTTASTTYELQGGRPTEGRVVVKLLRGYTLLDEVVLGTAPVRTAGLIPRLSFPRSPSER